MDKVGLGWLQLPGEASQHAQGSFALLHILLRRGIAADRTVSKNAFKVSLHLFQEDRPREELDKKKTKESYSRHLGPLSPGGQKG